MIFPDQHNALPLSISSNFRDTSLLSISRRVSVDSSSQFFLLLLLSLQQTTASMKAVERELNEHGKRTFHIKFYCTVYGFPLKHWLKDVESGVWSERVRAKEENQLRRRFINLQASENVYNGGRDNKRAKRFFYEILNACERREGREKKRAKTDTFRRAKYIATVLLRVRDNILIIFGFSSYASLICWVMQQIQFMRPMIDMRQICKQKKKSSMAKWNIIRRLTLHSARISLIFVECTRPNVWREITIRECWICESCWAVEWVERERMSW